MSYKLVPIPLARYIGSIAVDRNGLVTLPERAKSRL
jgi:hypothetical protein